MKILDRLDTACTNLRHLNVSWLIVKHVMGISIGGSGDSGSKTKKKPVLIFVMRTIFFFTAIMKILF